MLGSKPNALRRGVLLLFASAALTFAAEAPAKTTRPETIEVLDIAPVWAGHPVGFALLTRPPFQYVAYYDAQRRLTVARRRLSERKWSFHLLPITTGWDSHNYIVLAADNHGYLHLSGDMHVVPLNYFRTRKPQDAATFERVPEMVGQDEKRTTYPKFFRGPKNEFLFMYRTGSSGNGNQIFNIYDLKTKTWKRLLDQPLTDGEGQRNAYFDGPTKGPDGYFHLAWVWRETPDAASNHDLSYARSKDLIHWEAGNGKALALPISLKTSPIVDPVPEKGGILNSNIRLGFDDRDRATISYHKYDSAGYLQPWTARLEGGSWKYYQITNWPFRWEFGGGGSLGGGIGFGPVQCELDGRLTQSFRHLKFGGGTWLLDPQTLRAIGTVDMQRMPKLGKAEGTFPDLRVKWASDSGTNNIPGTRYALRWETLGANRDKPREGPLPPPSMLRVYLIKEQTYLR